MQQSNLEVSREEGKYQLYVIYAGLKVQMIPQEAKPAQP